MTIDYVDRILEANKDILDVYRVCIPFRVATCTSMYQSFGVLGKIVKEYMGSPHA